MREKGQVFTLDMLFASVLAASIMVVSSQALDIASSQHRSYSSRYSLERIAIDAADVLVKTAGKQENWENDVTILEVPGLAKENDGNPIQNFLDIGKLGRLMDLCEAKNWDPRKSEVQAIMGLFGGSEKFEIEVAYRDLLWRRNLERGKRFENVATLFGVEVEVDTETVGALIDVKVELRWNNEVRREEERAPEFVLTVEGGGISVEVLAGNGVIEVWYRKTLWNFWPGWDNEDFSGVENAIEVVVARRSVAMHFGKVVAEASRIALGKSGRVIDNLEFVIPSGGLEIFDWYFHVKTGAGKERREGAFLYVNREVRGIADYVFLSKPGDLEETFPKEHGGIENDLPDPPRTGEIHEGTNILNIEVIAGNAEAWIDVYVIALPARSSSDIVALAKYVLPAILKVKVWR